MTQPPPPPPAAVAAAPAIIPPALDHLILLTNDPHTASTPQNPSSLERAILTFSELGFQVVRGGTHADGLTSNALIIFQDGVYIELIQFEASPSVSKGETQQSFEARRREHWWYGCKKGWIDWCLLDEEGGDGLVEGVNDTARRLREGALKELENNNDKEGQGEGEGGVKVIAPRLLYEEPVEGGRITMGGDEIRWKVTFPTPPTTTSSKALPIGNTRSHVPFWCSDLTPRPLRVPPTYAQHDNHSPGIAEITLLYAKDTVTSYLDLSLALNQPVEPNTLPITTDFQLVPNEIPPRLLSTPVSNSKLGMGITEHPEYHKTTHTGSATGLVKVVVKVAEDPEDLKWIKDHGEGLYEVSIFVAADRLPSTAPPDGIERMTFEAGFGRVRLSPILH